MVDVNPAPIAPIATVAIPAQPQSYPIWLQAGLLQSIGHSIRSIRRHSRRWVVVTDETVARLYATEVLDRLTSEGFAPVLVTLPKGEHSKSLASLEQLWQTAQQNKLTRDDGFIALGGGVIGDVTGFAAATYQRGIGFVQVPTTLLAMVDASVGGKVAVHQGHFKNNIGAFYQPNAVIMDPDVLSSVPSREIASGWAEIIKTAMLESTALTNEVPQLAILSGSDPLDAQHPRLLDIVARCVAIKQTVVAADPTETTGHRMILNLGHTTAHALETVSGFGLLHGEAVALGLRVACILGAELGVCPSSILLQVEDWLQRANLPLFLSQVLPNKDSFAVDEVLSAMRGDKKYSSTGLRWVIPTKLPNQALGTVAIRSDVPEAQIRQALAQIGIAE